MDKFEDLFVIPAEEDGEPEFDPITAKIVDMSSMVSQPDPNETIEAYKAYIERNPYIGPPGCLGNRGIPGTEGPPGIFDLSATIEVGPTPPSGLLSCPFCFSEIDYEIHGDHLRYFMCGGVYDSLTHKMLGQRGSECYRHELIQVYNYLYDLFRDTADPRCEAGENSLILISQIDNIMADKILTIRELEDEKKQLWLLQE